MWCCVKITGMALRKDPLVVGEYYHLYNRGVDKRKIFLLQQDYRKFLFLMYVCNSQKSIILRDIGKNFDRDETIVDIGAFCLMPNHFHILVKEKVEGGISTYMRKLLTGYSMYFNRKNSRKGKLFDGAFKSSYATDDRYLKYLYSYIHFNPSKLIDSEWKQNITRDSEKLLDYCFSYSYSSIGEYRSGNYRITQPDAFPSYFLSASEHKSELSDWLTT